MATANKSAKRGSGIWLKLLLLIALAIGVVAWFYGEAIAGYSEAGTGYGAKNACSCRYLAGRELSQCYDDFIPGMGAIWLTEDEGEQSVTATIPLISSTTATYSEGYGCMIEPWTD